MSNNDRHLDLSYKFIQMGRALIEEGRKNKDYNTNQAGNMLILLSGLVIDDKDMNQFSELCSMFSAKKILQDMEKENHDFINFLKNKNDGDESLDDFLKRINKIRKDNGHDPIG